MWLPILITGLPVYFSAHAHVSGVVNPHIITDLFLLSHHVYVVQYVSTRSYWIKLQLCKDWTSLSLQSVFCLLSFTRSRRPRNLKSFSIILIRCTILLNYSSGEESWNWRRSHAGHQRKQTVTELASSSSSAPAESWRRMTSWRALWMFCLPELTLRPTRFNEFLYVGQKSWETEGSLTGSALSGWKFYLCNAGNARSYTVPKE